MLQINNNMRRAFTLVEILVVVTIIGLLTVAAVVSYSQFTKRARDSRRITDIEQLKAALEMYRSTNDIYPVATGALGTGYSTLSALTAPTVYIQSIPKDPKDATYLYYYTSAGTDYTLSAQLELTSSCGSAPGGSSCGAGNACNYCVGPYGQK